MKVPVSQATENMNWADYCDALRAEYWLRRLDLVKRPKHADFRIKPTDNSAKTPERKAEL